MNVKVEGIVLPNVPLSNFQIMDAAKKMKIKNFRGVFVRDQLPEKTRDKECGILNLDDSNGRGTHWVSWYKKGNLKIHFDSYGLPPPVEMINYLKSPVYYNSERVQPDGLVICGHLCLYILKKLSDGFNFQDVINSLY
jgi:hypothetical protein